VILHVDGGHPTGKAETVEITKQKVHVTARTPHSFQSIAEQFVLLSPDLRMLRGSPLEMPKSYKICQSGCLRRELFRSSSHVSTSNWPLGEMKHVATTKIRVSSANPGFEDFAQYVIEHDRVVKMPDDMGTCIFQSLRTPA